MKRMYGLGELGGDGGGDLAPVEAAVFNKYLVGVHSCHNYPCEKYTLTVAFERFRIGARLESVRFQYYTVGVEEPEIGAVADHCEDKVVGNFGGAIRRLDADRRGQDFSNR